MTREPASKRRTASADSVTVDLQRPGVVELLCNAQAMATWEVLRRHPRAVARADLAGTLGRGEAEVQRELDLLAEHRLVERVPASRQLRAGGWRVTCPKITVLFDPKDASHHALLSRLVDEFTERSIQTIRGINRGAGQLAQRRIKRAFSWLNVTDEEFEEVRLVLRSFDALVKRIEARQLREPSSPSDRPNLHFALCLTPLSPDALPMPPLEVTTRAALERDRGVHEAQNMDRLSPREREVIMLLLRGLTEKEAAGQLSLSPGTVRTHVVHAYEKLGVKRRSELSARVLGLAK
ncbi:MAG: response regulator transcription factor [Planctomycetota bacterium]